MKSDNPSEVGLHVFERAGLGKAPYTYLGQTVKLFCVPGQAPRAGSSCDYCGTAIASEFWLRGKDGRSFKVGCDCILRSGDEGLIRAYKTDPQIRAKERAKRAEKSRALKAEVESLVRESAGRLALLTHPQGFINRETGVHLTALDWAHWMLDHCGHSGRQSLLRRLKLMLAPEGRAS